MSLTESDQESKILLTDEEVAHLKNQDEKPFDFDRPDYVFVPKGIHNWRQEGIYIVCRSCDVEHAIFIGPDKMMVGMDSEGKPILVDSSEYFKNGYKHYSN